jgi:2'-5' RNA ligase
MGQSNYEFGCVMLYLNNKLTALHKYIDKNDIYVDPEDPTFGLEKEPHVTLLYGLHEEVTPKQIKSVLKDFEFGKLLLHNVSLFENEKYDVLKFDIEGDSLHQANDELKQFPYTSDFPDYHPHSTIAYLKSGKGKKYVKKFKDLELETKPKYAVYSQPNGNKTKFSIKIQK